MVAAIMLSAVVSALTPMKKAGPKIRIDWFMVINDLCRLGFQSQRIADRVGVAKSTLLGWKQGAEPKHSEGDRLLCLWVEITGKHRDDAPVISIYSCRA